MLSEKDEMKEKDQGEGLYYNSVCFVMGEFGYFYADFVLSFVMML